jgi:hypothetical protein
VSNVFQGSKLQSVASVKSRSIDICEFGVHVRSETKHTCKLYLHL